MQPVAQGYKGRYLVNHNFLFKKTIVKLLRFKKYFVLFDNLQEIWRLFLSYCEVVIEVLTLKMKQDKLQFT